MKYDFSDVDNTQDFVNLDPGWYTVCVHEVREGRTRDGDPRWGLLMRVAEGEFAGRFAAWDGIVWAHVKRSPVSRRPMCAISGSRG